ncbi:MAG: cation diffusion facilitator family transporter [Myxococcota bacterium]
MHSHDHSHDGHDHGHSHDHSTTPVKALWVAIILNALFLVVEFAVGLYADSLALLADAGHMLSDVGALVLALVAQRIASRAASADYTFGLRRVPVLGGLANGATLIIIVVLIFREAIGRIIDPTPVQEMPVLIVGGIGLFINLVSAWYLHQSGDESVNIRGAMLHLLADALGSVAAMGSALVILFTGWMPIDPILSIVIGILIMVGSWPLLRDTINIMLQRAPAGIDVSRLASALEEHPDVLEVSDLHVWELNSGEPVLTAMVCTPVNESLVEANQRKDQVKTMLAEDFGIDHATIEWCHASTKAKPVDF